MNIFERNYVELGRTFRAVWKLYLMFHTAFLAFNLAGLCFDVHYLKTDERKLIVWAFIFQNIISALTDLGIAAYTRHTASHQRALIRTLAEKDALIPSQPLALSSVVPERLGVWAGLANAVAHLVFIYCWVATLAANAPNA